MKGLRLGIFSVEELREHLAQCPTDNGGVTVNRGLLRQLLKAVDGIDKYFVATTPDELGAGEDMMFEAHSEIVRSYE